MKKVRFVRLKCYRKWSGYRVVVCNVNRLIAFWVVNGWLTNLSFFWTLFKFPIKVCFKNGWCDFVWQRNLSMLEFWHCCSSNGTNYSSSCGMLKKTNNAENSKSNNHREKGFFCCYPFKVQLWTIDSCLECANIFVDSLLFALSLFSSLLVVCVRVCLYVYVLVCAHMQYSFFICSQN